MTVRKRFIAGAVCPGCGEQDKLVVYLQEGEAETRECVACGFTEKMGSDEMKTELPTRVAPAVSVDPGVKPLRLVANPVSKG